VAPAALPVAPPPPAPVPPAPTPPAPTLTTELTARPARAVVRYPIPQLVGVEGLYGLSISADNQRVLVSSDRSGVFNAWAIPLDGSASTALTASNDSIFVDSYFPRDQRVLYTADRGGDEQSHVYLRDLDGQIRDLTPGTNLKASFLDWSGDGRSFFILTNERDARYFDLYEYGGFGRQRVWQNDQGFDIAAVSPDKRWLALGRETTTNDSDVWVYDTQSKELRNLTAHAGVVRNDVQTFSADSSRLYLTSNADGEFADLVAADLASGQRQTVLRAGWDVAAARLSRDRRFLVVQVNADARTQLELLDAKTLRPTSLPALANLAITQVELSRDGSLMAFYAESSNEPRNLYVYEFASGKVQRLTNSLGAIPAADLVAAEVVRYASLDGLTVPALLYRPLTADASHPVPAVVVVHGGPGGQSRAQYSDLVQVLSNSGYAVLAVNNRGSSGYGKTFYSLDDRHHGEGDLDDCVAGRRWLARQDWVAADRIGIVGGSYGGFMVLAALAFRPTEFAVGVDLYGVANWPRTLASMPAWWGSARDAILAELGDPTSDSERLQRISPLFHTEGIVRPLLVLQGANDPRVLPAESDEIVAALRARSVPVEYVTFADEGHGFVKRSSTEQAYAAIVGFLDRYLIAASQAATP
jgi:dipeptidyl aminopeptidase/acylaminoacyl peptidase